MRVPRISFAAAVMGLGMFSGACDPGIDTSTPVTTERQALTDAERELLVHRWRGQTRFLSRLSFSWGPIIRPLEEASRKDLADATRSVEEADIYRWDAERKLLYTLNAYRGLQIIDLAQPDAPELRGQDRLGGQPIEMFLRGNVAYVLLNSYAEAQDPTREQQGAFLRVYDVSDPAAPVERAEFPVAGAIQGSHLLTATDGSSAVIYVVSNVYGYDDPGTPEVEPGPATHVLSISVTDPAAPVEVDRVSFAGESTATHVTPSAVFVASHEWQTDVTRVQYVDIADLGGAIRVRGSIELQGRLRWGERGDLQLDLYEGTLRVASEIRAATATEQPFIRLLTIDVSRPDALTPLGQLDVGQGHALVAVRFSGKRAYLFHMVQVDPLEVIDLSDPVQPRSLGILRIQGWVNHIEVRGEQLITLGVMAADPQQLALILFDVRDPAQPRELARVPIGEGSSWTDAVWDLRAFRVIDELGLVILPVTTWSAQSGRVQAWLQIARFDLAAGTLSARGRVSTLGAIRRALPVADDRLVAFGEMGLQVIDVADPDVPTVTGTLELARDVSDFVAVAGHGVVLVAAGWDSNLATELRTVPLPRADERLPLGRVELPVAWGRIFRTDPRHVAVVGQEPGGDGTRVIVVDVTDARAPRITGELALPGVYAYLMEAMPDAIVLGTTDWSTGQARLLVISLADPTAPVESATVELDERLLQSVHVRGRRAYVSAYRSLDPPQSVPDAPRSIIWPPRASTVAYDLHVVGVDDPDAPEITGPISIPGEVVGASGPLNAPWAILNTDDRFRSFDGRDPVRGLHSLFLFEHASLAMLLDLIEVPDQASPIQTDGLGAFFTRTVFSETGPARTHLHAIDLRLANHLVEADVLEVPGVGYGYLSDVEQGRAFVRSGWAMVSVIDTSDVHDLRARGSFAAPGWFDRVIRVGARAFLPAGIFGTHVLPVWP